MKLRFEAGSISVQFEHYLGLILLSIIITHHDASSVFFFLYPEIPNPDDVLFLIEEFSLSLKGFQTPDHRGENLDQGLIE
jgi:hypothetical protein